MKEAFQDIVLRLALWGLAASIAVLTLRSWPVRAALARLAAAWRGLTAFGRFAVCVFLLVGVIEADKTNGVNNLPPQQMMQSGGSFRTGFTGFSGIRPQVPSFLNPVSLVNPVRTTLAQSSFAERKAANWNVRGAWRDSFWLPFGEGWVFPHGSNHLSGVEVVACGQVWPTPFDTNAVAAIGVPVEVVPGLSSFECEFTPSNSCRFAWTDAAVDRDTNNLVSASIELFRNGDWCVTTNGTAHWGRRVLPYPHDGFGQDGEWVAANFTNSTEILSTGYSEWVDAQVGTGLTNGLYKFTAVFPDDPPETVRLMVGGYSTAVTNAGEYVFLLEKGVDYEYGTFPFLTNVEYSVVDDIAPLLRSSSNFMDGQSLGEWTVDGGYGMISQSEQSPGLVWWMPMFFGSPDVLHFGPHDGTLEFTANFADCVSPPAASYQWTATGDLQLTSPNAQSTGVDAGAMPSWSMVCVSVCATFGDHSLSSQLDLVCGTNDMPQVHLHLDMPDAVLLNSNNVSDAKIAAAGWRFTSDAPTTGVVRVSCLSGGDKVDAQGLVGEWAVVDSGFVDASVEGVAASSALGDVVFRMEFSCGEDTNSTEKAVTVVRVGDVRLPAAPADGLVVLTNTPVAMALDCEPAGAGAFLSTIWHTRRLKSDGSHEGWQLAEYGHTGPGIVFTPQLGGIYQVRALASVAAGGADERFYVWEADENSLTGLKKRGDMKAFGVCDEQWQIDIRNCAKSFIGSTAYLELSDVPAQYGFSASPGMEDVYKCNLFVAHRALQSGLAVPAIHGRLWRAYPPLANEWGNRAFAIEGWACVDTGEFTQTGYVSSQPSGDDTPGHLGIVDFDGMGISAGMRNVNRNFNACGATTVLRRYNSEVSE